MPRLPGSNVGSPPAESPGRELHPQPLFWQVWCINHHSDAPLHRNPHFPLNSLRSPSANRKRITALLACDLQLKRNCVQARHIFPATFFFFFFPAATLWFPGFPPTPHLPCCHFRASRSQGEAATYEKLISPLPPHPPRGLGGDPQPHTRFGLFAFAAAAISKHVIFLWILMRLIRLLSGTTPIHWLPAFRPWRWEWIMEFSFTNNI